MYKEKRKENISEDVYSEEMDALLGPYAKESKFKKLWEKLHTPIKQINGLMLVTFFVGVVFIFLTFFIIFTPNSSTNSQREERFGLIAKLETLKQSHNYYTTMATKDELLSSWIKLFSKWEYSLGGDPRYDKGDCVGAVYEFFKKWDSNVYFENVRGIVSRAENLSERNELLKRKHYNEIHTGDLIVIQLKPNAPEHVGIVYDTTNGYVRYMDVNAGVRTWGLEKEKWGSFRIYAIYQVSYSLWLGDMMKKINGLN